MSPKQGIYRPDATAWAILALETRGYNGRALQSSCDRLVADQRFDGWVCVSSMHGEAFRPTSLAILAWQSSPKHDEPRTRTVRYLLNTSGRHWPHDPQAPAAHDTSLRKGGPGSGIPIPGQTQPPWQLWP